MVLQMTMLSRIEHCSTTLLAVGEPRNNSENYIFTFPGKCSKSLYQSHNGTHKFDLDGAGSSSTQGKVVSEKSECNNSGYKLTWWP